MGRKIAKLNQVQRIVCLWILKSGQNNPRIINVLPHLQNVAPNDKTVNGRKHQKELTEEPSDNC